MNLLNTVKDVYTDHLIEKIANTFELSVKDTATALETFLPGLLGGIFLKARTNKGAETILDTINKGDFNDSSRFDLDKILKNKDEITIFLEMGSNLVESLFGNTQSELLNFLLKNTGLSKSNGSKLFSFITPVVMKKLSDQVFTNEYDVRGLKNYMSIKNRSFLSLAPGLGRIFADDYLKHTMTHNYIEIDEPKNGSGWWKWLIPFLL